MRQKFAERVIGLLVALLSPFPRYSCAAVPPGFEAIETERTSMVDVYFLGKRIATTSAYITLRHITLSASDDVLTRLPLRVDLPEPTRQSLALALRSPLERHGERACGETVRKDVACNHIDTDTVAVVFDEATDIVHLWINHGWLTTKRRDDAWYAPTPGSSAALIHRQRLNATVLKQQTNVGMHAGGSMGVGANGFVGLDYGLYANHGHYRHLNEAQLNALYYRHDLTQRHYVQTGRIAADGLYGRMGGGFRFAMLPIGTIDGVRLGTTRAYQRDTSSLRHSPLPIMLNRTCRVDAYRDLQLLGTFYLEAGAHEIATHDFPPGNYLVTLKVVEDGRITRTEIVPFTGVEAGHAAVGEIDWFAQLGQGAPAFRGARRASSSAGVQIALPWNVTASLGGLMCDERAKGELRLEWTRRFAIGALNARASVFAANEGSHGHQQQLHWHSGSLTLFGVRDAGLSMSVFRTSSNTSAASTAAAIGSSINARTSYDFRSLGATASIHAAQWYLSAGYGRTSSMYAMSTRPERVDEAMHRQAAAPDPTPVSPDTSLDRRNIPRLMARETLSSQLQMTLGRAFRWRRLALHPGVTVSRRRYGGRPTDTSVVASLTMSCRTPARAVDGFAHTTTAGASLTHRDRALVRSHGRYQIDRPTGTLRLAGVGLAADGAGQLIDVDAGAHIASPLANVQFSVADSYSRIHGVHYPSANVDLANVLTLSKDGVALNRDAGTVTPSAAIAVRVDEAPEVGADVMLPKTTVPAAPFVRVGEQALGFGDRAVLPVDAYAERQLDVQEINDPRIAEPISVTTGTHAAPMYMLPGRIKTHRIGGAVNYTYIARFFANDGAPDRLLSGAFVLDAPVSPVNEAGYLVADFPRAPQQLHLLQRGRVYACPIPDAQVTLPVQNMGDIFCEAVAVKDLPKALRYSPRVLRLLK